MGKPWYKLTSEQIMQIGIGLSAIGLTLGIITIGIKVYEMFNQRGG